MGAQNPKYYCLVKLFAAFEMTSHLILDQVKLLFWQINYVPINHFRLDYFQFQPHTYTSRQYCFIAERMNFWEDKQPQLPLTSFSVVSVRLCVFVFFLSDSQKMNTWTYQPSTKYF